jgi:hypothetical protein
MHQREEALCTVMGKRMEDGSGYLVIVLKKVI